MTTENPVGMTPHQHLRSEAIYRINSVLASIVEDESTRSSDDQVFNTRTTQLQPTLFDPCSRKFRWLLVDREDWRLNPKSLRGLLKRLQDLHLHDDEKEKFINHCSEKFEHFDGDLRKQCMSFLCEIRGGTLNDSETLDALGGLIDALIDAEEKQQHFHHAFMKILEERTFEKTGYYDGLILKLIEDRPDHKIEKEVPLDWVSSTVAHGIQGFPLKDVVASYGSFQRGPFVYSQELEKEFPDLESLQKEYETSKREGAYDSWEVAIQKVVARNIQSNHIVSMNHIVSIPIFDGWAVRLPWGRLIGVVHVVHANADVGALDEMRGNALIHPLI